MKVLFFSPVPFEGAGCRARIVQYLPALKAQGIEGVVRPFMDSAFFASAYRPGQRLRKAACFLRSNLRRVRECLEAGAYDVIYIYRECAPIGPPLFEWLLFRWGKPVVYDFDDAVHLPDRHTGRAFERLWSRLKWHSKIPWILRRCDHVVAGNTYLRAYAEPLNPRVTVVPTAEEPSRFNGMPRPSGARRMTIGWIGTHSTVQYLLKLQDVFRTVARRHEIELKVVGAGRPLAMPGVRVVELPWSLEQEAQIVQGFDIGVYPLSGSEFDLGKACYKAILYMAAGVPVVASNHGANREIIQHEINGLLAASGEEWVTQLTRLIEDAALRARLVAGGRKTVETHYSVAVNAPKLVQVLRGVSGHGEEPRA